MPATTATIKSNTETGPGNGTKPSSSTIQPSGLILENIEGGFRVRQVGNYYLDVMYMMLGNRRLCRTPVDSPYEYHSGWCYRGPRALQVAVAEALRWPDDDVNGDHVPDRWYKDVFTGKTQERYFEDAAA